MKRTIAAACAAILAAVAWGAHSIAQTPAPEIKYVQAGRVLADPSTGQVATEQTIVVVNGKVTEIRPGYVDAQYALNFLTGP